MPHLAAFTIHGVVYGKGDTKPGDDTRQAGYLRPISHLSQTSKIICTAECRRLHPEIRGVDVKAIRPSGGGASFCNLKVYSAVETMSEKLFR